MQNLTPDWEEIGSSLISKLDEVAEELDLSIEFGADPAYAVTSAIEELQCYINAINEGNIQ
jgi:hypothetical protein